MTLNSFVWDLYTSSQTGSALLEELAKKELDPDLDEVSILLVRAVEGWAKKKRVRNDEDALTLLDELSAGIPLSDEVLKKAFGDTQLIPVDLLTEIYYVTSGLCLAHPEYFLPYMFQNAFDQLEELSAVFGLALPLVPPKADVVRRVRYYGLINQGWQEFRRAHNMSTNEMMAFLYDFAPHFLADTTELPEPSKVWLLIGGAGEHIDFATLDGAGPDDTFHWQASPDTRRGDLLLMYCKSPRSYLHSVWRAVTDGFEDPFFFYKSTVWLGHPLRVPELSFREMKAHPVLANNAYFKANLQGASGKPLTLEEYDAILELLCSKGFGTKGLPRPQGLNSVQVGLKDEREVEERLVNPLLERLGYRPDDWMRQMPLRMGRGERVFPDYAFFPNMRRGEESARMVLETKYRIPGERALRETYYQAKSYALRLQAQTLVIAAAEGVWVFRDGPAFPVNDCAHFSWDDLAMPDNLYRLRQLAGPASVNP